MIRGFVESHDADIHKSKVAEIADIPGGPLVIFRVDGEAVREMSAEAVDFVEGGHWLVYDFIPRGEIWIERLRSSEDEMFILIHEFTEVLAMLGLRLDYDRAHGDIANPFESVCRRYAELSESSEVSRD